MVNNEDLGFLSFFCSDVFLVGFLWAARPWLPNFCLKSHQFVSSLFNVEILANLLSLRRFIADIRDAANEPCEPARSVIAWESSDEESSTHPHTPPSTHLYCYHMVDLTEGKATQLLTLLNPGFCINSWTQREKKHWPAYIFPLAQIVDKDLQRETVTVPLRRNRYLLFVSP